MQDFIEKLKVSLEGEKGGLESQLLMAPEFREQEIQKRVQGIPTRKSAVLLLFNPFLDEISLIFTRRSSTLRVHRGQVSFPGGSMDQEDSDLEETALREACEEIGVCPNEVEVIGNLSDLFIPPSNFDVHCVVGVLKNEPNYNINPDEVAEIVEVPLSMLRNPNNIKRKNFMGVSSKKDLWAPYYDVKGLEIWGATAMIVSELIELTR